MPLITWDDSFLVGVTELDAHNRQFVKLVNIIFGEFSRDTPEDSRLSLLTTLKSLGKFQFRYEEQWMSKMHFSQLEEHRQEHVTFLARMDQSLDARAQDDADLLQFLAEWLDSHLTFSNQQLRLFVSTQTQTYPP